MENPGANQLVDVVVEHEYVAAQEDELTLRRGDVVRLAERRAGGWMCGELRGRTGLFPDNFVRVIGASHDLPQDLILRNSVPRFCRAVFSYQQANPDELSLCVGDVIQVLGEVEEGWWRGQKGQLRGVFPSNFVVPEPAPPPLLPPKPIREQCRVLFPYTAANGDELTLGEGDIVTIVSRDVPDQGWWRGELHGRIGLFPDNFVTVLPVPYIPGSVSPADTNKKPGRPAKNLTSNKNQPVSMNRKDSTSSKSSVGSAHENVAAVRKSLEITDPPVLESQKPRKSLEPAETPTNPGTRKSIDGEDAGDQKSRKSLEVEGGKPPVPVKKAGSPVAAMLSGLRQKVLAVEHRLTGQQSSPSSTDAADGSVGSKPCSGEPVLVGVSPAPSPQPPPACDSPQPDAQPQDGFDQVERTSMLNDPRAGRVKAPRRRPPSQALRDDVPLTNGGTHHTTSTDPPAENEIIKPKAREWEKHKAPWMEELKLNQAKKTSPIAEIGRSKTIATTDSASNDKGTEGTPTRLSGSSDKILDAAAGDGDKDAPANALEMSQSMTSISSRTIKIETAQEVQGRTENPLDLSKSMSSIASRSSHLETNSKVSPGELRTSVTTSSSVTLRGSVSPTPTPVTRLPTSRLSGSHLGEQQQQLQGSPARVHSVSAAQRDNYVYMAMNDEKTMLNNDVSHSHTPEQLLIAQLNERVANLEKVVEAQEARFSSALSALSARLTKEVELRNSLQAELQKLERCVTHV